ncbi:kinetochore-associated protein NSL1 homolog [Halichoeres trimaculatus]|uniref:kinetochore-associated protein NSL1 homolog n=1 Tax=Halichoeres trimaculatus TaxID=147232 RepID=UPI003D9EB2E5
MANRESSPRDENKDETTEEEYRIKVPSKKRVTELIDQCKEVLKTALDGQTDVKEDVKKELILDLLANFEAAVQENVLVNGKPWEEAPDDEENEAVDLESLLDDTIVETTRRRRSYPRKILPHFLHALKAERKLMGLYQQVVKPQEVLRDPDHESMMKDLSSAAPVMVKQAIQVIKSINTLQKQAEGLCEVLNMKPSPASMEIHREVFGPDSQSDAHLPPGSRAARSREPIKRAVEDAAAANCYVPLSKKAAAEETME